MLKRNVIYFAILSLCFLNKISCSYFQEASIRDTKKRKPEILLESPTKKKIMTSREYDITEFLCKRFEKVDKNGVIILNAYFFTSDKLASCLVAASKRGAEIHVIVDKESYDYDLKKNKILNKLNDKGVYVYVHNFKGEKSSVNIPIKSHSKAVIWKYVDPETKQEKFRVFRGTTNFTYASESNWEASEIIPDDKESFDLYWNFALDIARRSQKFSSKKKATSKAFDVDKYLKDTSQRGNLEIIEKTPEKTKVIFSHQHDFIASIILSINKTKEDDDIQINSYTYSYQKLTEALIKALERKVKVTLIVDQQSLKTSGSIEQLKELKKSGAKIYVFNQDLSKKVGDSDIPVKNHLKNILIYRKDKSITFTSSGNFVEKSKDDFNDLIIEPENYVSYFKYMGINFNVISESVEFDENLVQSKISKKLEF